jgi:hypothetical protein
LNFEGVGLAPETDNSSHAQNVDLIVPERGADLDHPRQRESHVADEAAGRGAGVDFMKQFRSDFTEKGPITSL